MPPPPTSSQNTLGPYTLLHKLGEGGMGTVFLAHDTALDRRVAIKLLRSPPNATRSFQATLSKRFLREARSAARISHPHVALIYAVGQHADTPYLVMEYLDAGSLASRLLAHGPLHWRDALHSLRHALLGLAAAHAHGIIHRDLKPANLMQTHAQDGSLITKLVDFGLARIASAPADPDLTFPGAFVGSPHYAAPEQITGQPGAVDGRADLYALAATLFTLLTAQPPFPAEDAADTLHHHLHSPFPALKRLAPTAPPALQKLLTRASAKHPGERYQSAPEMLFAVEAILNDPSALLGESAPQVTALPTDPPAPLSAHQPPPPRFPDLSIHDLESQLSRARALHDSSSQLQALRALIPLYTTHHRHADAALAQRHALALHIKLNAPSGTLRDR